MPRKKGDGWGNGMILFWQLHESCGKKKALWDYGYRPYFQGYFWCTVCKERFISETLIKQRFKGYQNIWSNKRHFGKEETTRR
jgi:hypothetical protein